MDTNLPIAKRRLGEINPAAYNPRRMSDDDLAMLDRSIAEFGFVEPLVVNKDGTLIGGHQRYKVLLKRLGRDAAVDCCTVDLPKHKEMALNLALNKIHGTWDYKMVMDVIAEIDTGEFDVELTGFREGDLEEATTWVGDKNSWQHFGQQAEDAVNALKEKAMIVCPKCGHEFDRRSNAGRMMKNKAEGKSSNVVLEGEGDGSA